MATDEIVCDKPAFRISVRIDKGGQFYLFSGATGSKHPITKDRAMAFKSDWANQRDREANKENAK